MSRLSNAASIQSKSVNYVQAQLDACDWDVYIPDGFGGMVEMDFFENMCKRDAAELAKAKFGKGCTVVRAV